MTSFDLETLIDLGYIHDEDSDCPTKDLLGVLDQIKHYNLKWDDLSEEQKFIMRTHGYNRDRNPCTKIPKQDNPSFWEQWGWN